MKKIRDHQYSYDIDGCCTLTVNLTKKEYDRMIILDDILKELRESMYYKYWLWFMIEEEESTRARIKSWINY